MMGQRKAFVFTGLTKMEKGLSAGFIKKTDI